MHSLPAAGAGPGKLRRGGSYVCVASGVHAGRTLRKMRR